jgi:hypothetical protein
MPYFVGSLFSRLNAFKEEKGYAVVIAHPANFDFTFLQSF